MGMLMHRTLVEMEKKTPKDSVETKVEKPVEVPKEEPAEPVKRTGGRRKTTIK